MTNVRPRIVVFRGDTPLTPEALDALQATFDLLPTDNVDAVDHADRPTFILADATLLGRLAPDAQAGAAAASIAIEHIGEAVGMVRPDGSFVWMDPRLARMSATVRAQFADLCREALTLFTTPPPRGETVPTDIKFLLRVDSTDYDLVVGPASTDPGSDGPPTIAVGVLWDVTETRTLQSKVDAIDAAGAELMKIEADAIADLDATARLKILEQKIVRYVHDLLNFDNFEIRLLNRRTSQLELVTTIGISPLKIGEVIFARPEANGISGFVAATGRSYYCPNVQADPLYREGLDNARCSLTVPLSLHDEVIGVFNIESNSVDAFDENDRQFAEIFARYIAMALNILDLLVVERYTTSRQASATMLDEINRPLGQVREVAATLQSRDDLDDGARIAIDRIVAGLNSVKQAVEQTSAGPHTILGTDAIRNEQPEPLMSGKHVLVTDDEPAIREGVQSILTQKGCSVTMCASGSEAMDAIGTPADAKPAFDLIISDIKMPDYNGYEIFVAAREIDLHTPVILMTGFGYDPHHSIVRASQEGLHSFLFKPFKAEQLLAEARKAFTAVPGENGENGENGQD